MSTAVELNENPLALSRAEFKTLNGYVITQGEVKDILREFNRVINEKLDKDWLESILESFGIRVDVAIERWIRSILGGGFGTKTALKLLLSGKSILVTILVGVFKSIWSQAANALLKATVNGVAHAAWAEVESRGLKH